MPVQAMAGTVSRKAALGICSWDHGGFGHSWLCLLLNEQERQLRRRSDPQHFPEHGGDRVRSLQSPNCNQQEATIHVTQVDRADKPGPLYVNRSIWALGIYCSAGR